MKLWQLKNLKTNETLNEPQLLPENWGPIFGLSGVVEKLSDLSWLGPDYTNLGWFEVGDAPPDAAPSSADLVWEDAKQRLRESDWAMLPDVPMIASQKTAWIEYRKKLREIKLQPGFPDNVTWPNKPE